MLLVDTSVWIEVFRRPSRFELGSVADLDEVVTCLPVIQEVFQRFWRSMPFVSLGRRCSLSPSSNHP